MNSRINFWGYWWFFSANQQKNNVTFIDLQNKKI